MSYYAYLCPDSPSIKTYFQEATGVTNFGLPFSKVVQVTFDGQLTIQYFLTDDFKVVEENSDYSSPDVSGNYVAALESLVNGNIFYFETQTYNGDTFMRA